jgi:hypothetical protein
MTAKTIVLLNPDGADVTTFVNHTAFVPQLLNGSVFNTGDTLYTLPYTNETGSANVTAGVALLDTKLRALAAASSQDILVFGYSEGCQVADQWISAHYADTTLAVPAGQLSFLSIGNADRKYGGFAYHQPCFESYCYTGGLPNAHIPWAYTDFARQYDPISDFPQAVTIQNALDDLTLALSSINLTVWEAGLSALTTALGSSASQACVNNLVDGLEYIHINYLEVQLTDIGNIWYTDPVTGVRYGISPTWPVPALGLSTWFPALDTVIRAQVELSYSRIFGPMPLPSQDAVAVSDPGPVTDAIPAAQYLLQIATMLNTLGYLYTMDGRIATAATQLGVVTAEWSSNPVQAQIDARTLLNQLTALAVTYEHSTDLANAVDAAEALIGAWSGNDYDVQGN